MGIEQRQLLLIFLSTFFGSVIALVLFLLVIRVYVHHIFKRELEYFKSGIIKKIHKKLD